MSILAGEESKGVGGDESCKECVCGGGLVRSRPLELDCTQALLVQIQWWGWGTP